MEQIRVVPVKVAALCERLGWRGPEGFERLQQMSAQTVRDWVVIADMEREREQKHADR